MGWLLEFKSAALFVGMLLILIRTEPLWEASRKLLKV
jgi:hypothetical protein